MPDEIDRLEIAVEAEANNANRALSGMEKRLNKVANALEKVMIMAQGGVSFENVDVSKLFAGNAINKAAKKAGKDLSDGLIKGFNLNKADADVQRQVKSLVGKISDELAKSSGKPYAGINADMEQLAKTVSKNGSVARKTLGEYKELYETVKSLGKIKIHPDTAKSLGDSYKDRTGLLRQKLSTSSDGTELDTVYGELRDKFPSILKDVNNVEDEFLQLDSAVKRFYSSVNAFEKPEWLEDAAYESVIDGFTNLIERIQYTKKETEQLTESMHGIKDTGKSFSELFGAGMDTSGLEKATALIKDATQPRTNGVSNQRMSRADLKYPAKSLKELQNQFKDSRLEVDFSSKGGPELRKEIGQNERAFQRMKQSIADKISLAGTDELSGKDWYRSVMQMNQYRNAVVDATESLKLLEAEKKKANELAMSKINITRDGDEEQHAPEVINEKVPTVIKESAINAKNLSDNLKKVSVPKESLDDAKQLGYRLADASDKMDKVSKQSAFRKFPQMMMDSFKLNEDGQLPALKKFSDTFRKSIGSMPMKVMDFMKLDESGSLKGISSLKEKIRESGNAKMKAPDTSAVDEKISQIKRNISEMKNALQGEINIGDFDSAEETYQDILKLSKALKEYEGIKEQAFGNAEKVNSFGKALSGIKNTAKGINSVKKSFNDVSKAVQNARGMASKAIHPFRTLKELIAGTSNQGNKGMSWGRMIGSSIMFSSIFGAISQIKEAIKAGSDNLVQYSSSYNNSISSMVSSLLYLKNAWAAAFAPIVNVVAPYISQFIDMIAGALNAVGQFMAALTGKGYTVQAKKAWYDYGKSITDTSNKTADATKNTDKANKAAKEFRKTVLSFDELNMLNAPDTSSSGSGSNPNSGAGAGGKYTGPSASEMFETIEVPNSMNKLAEMFKDAIAKSDFTDIGRMISDKLSNALESIDWQKIYHYADNFGKDLATFLNGLITPRLFYDLGATIAGAINTAFHAANSFAINFDWSNLGTSLAKSIKGFFENWDAGLTGATFGNFFSGIFDSMSSFLNTLSGDDAFKTIGQKLVDLLCGVDWGKCAWSLAGFFSAFYNALIDFPADFVEGIGESLIEHITGSKFDEEARKKFEEKLAPIKKAYKFILEGINPFTRIKRDIEFAVNAFAELQKFLDKFKKDIQKKLEDLFKPSSFVEIGKNILKGIARGFAERFDLFPALNFFNWVYDRICELFGIHSPAKNMEPLGENIFLGIVKGFENKFDSFTDAISQWYEKNVKPWFSTNKWSGLSKNVKSSFSDIDDWFGKKFQKARNLVNEKFQNVGTWFFARKTDVQKAHQDVDSWFNTKYQNARTYVNGAFSNIGDWFAARKNEIQSAHQNMDSWFSTKYQSARAYVNGAFNNVGTWFGSRRNDVQNAQNSISSWFSTKYQSARSSVNSAFNNVGSWFGNRRNDIQSNMSSIASWFRSTFQKAYNAITGIFNNIGSYFWRIGENIKSPIRNALNGVISGVNWVLGKLGSKTRFSAVRFATGTGANGVPQDTLGVVNDQAGGTYREMVQFPNGKTIIPKGRNVMLPMPKGTKVLPANKTAALMQAQNIPHFKKGIGDFFGGAWAKFKNFTGDVLDYAEHPKKLMQIAIDKFTDLRGAVEPGLSMAKGAVNTVFDSAVNKIKGLLKDSGGNVKYKPSAGVEQWRSLAKRALQMTNQYSEANLNRLLMQMKSESGGNPNAINNWDSNAKKGIPSKGLMQVIDPTFRAYALAPHNKNIYDPLSNMLAAIRYTVSRYGSLAKGWKGHGYELGGFPKNGEVYVANENGFGSEMIGKMGNRNVVANNQQITDGIKEAVIDAMMEVYIATQNNGADSNGTIPYIINAVLKTEDNEVLARAVEKGQASRSSRFNPSPAY